MVLYVILIALVNVALGYALGVYLGYSPAVWRQMSTALPSDDGDAPETTSKAGRPQLAQTATSESTMHQPSVLEKLLDRFVSCVVELRGGLLQLDQEIGRGEDRDHWLNQFRGLKDEHLRELNSSLEEFDRQKAAFSALADTGGRIQYAVREQMKAVASADRLDADGNSAREKICQIVRDLTAATDHCQDELEVARLEIARTEGWLTESDAACPADRKSRMQPRATAEAAIARLWETASGGRAQLCVALIEADLYRQILSDHGPDVCDRVLAAVGRLVSEVATADELVVRYATQQYMIVYPDKLARQCANKVETVRQQVEQSRFVGSRREVRLTTSCAVVQAAEHDTLPTLISRLEETLEEAKRYGRNRTFIHEGKYPAPLVPPELDIPLGMVEF